MSAHSPETPPSPVSSPEAPLALPPAGEVQGIFRPEMPSTAIQPPMPTPAEQEQTKADSVEAARGNVDAALSGTETTDVQEPGAGWLPAHPYDGRDKGTVPLNTPPENPKSEWKHVPRPNVADTPQPPVDDSAPAVKRGIPARLWDAASEVRRIRRLKKELRAASAQVPAEETAEPVPHLEVSQQQSPAEPLPTNPEPISSTEPATLSAQPVTPETPQSPNSLMTPPTVLIPQEPSRIPWRPAAQTWIDKNNQPAQPDQSTQTPASPASVPTQQDSPKPKGLFAELAVAVQQSKPTAEDGTPLEDPTEVSNRYYEYERQLDAIYQPLAKALSDRLKPKVDKADVMDKPALSTFITYDAIQDRLNAPVTRAKKKARDAAVADAIAQKKPAPTETALRQIENRVRVRPIDLSKLPDVMVWRHGSEKLRIVSKPKITKIVDAEGKEHTFVVIARKTITNYDAVKQSYIDPRLIGTEDRGSSDGNQQQQTPEQRLRARQLKQEKRKQTEAERRRKERFEVEFYTLPDGFDSSNGLRGLGMDDLTRVPNYSSVKWSDTTIHRARGMSYDEVEKVCSAISMVLGTRPVQLPERPDNVPERLDLRAELLHPEERRSIDRERIINAQFAAQAEAARQQQEFFRQGQSEELDK